MVFNLSFCQKKLNKDILEFVNQYEPIYKCNNQNYEIPKFKEIDIKLYKKIEKQFLNENYNCLYLLIVPVILNHNVYINKFNQEFIIDEGLTCQEKSIIKLIRIAMRSKKFNISHTSQEIETTGDILYWVNKNKEKIRNYYLIFSIANQKEKMISGNTLTR
jgi:hypothetical protein